MSYVFAPLAGAAAAIEGDDGHNGNDQQSSPAISLSNKMPKQGEVVEVQVNAADLGGDTAGGAADQGADSKIPALEVLGCKYKLFPGKTAAGRSIYRALFTVPVVQKPGPQKLICGPLQTNFAVKDAGFQVQRLTLPPSKNNFVTAPGEEEAVDAAKATVSSERFWQGNFVRPSHARTSAPFGIRRIVNGKLLPDYFHSGLDFAGFAGSPIYATAPGTVVLAQGGGVFKLHGNMVAIDHGQGVVSFYIHMQKVLVKKGQQVKGGEQIGMVGSTGRANGPHLHFSIYCNKVASSPLQWFNKAP
ncbi:MAG: M23 family metallopeptidase [Cyanobacteria bacterium REEB67]|nr:M23 family metallopeptidase [Cyanobacteria bacterium REEB67]